MLKAFNRRHIVHDVHGDGTGSFAVIHIRYRHGNFMADIVRLIIARAVFQRIVAQRIGIAQLAVSVARRQRAFAMHVQSRLRAVQGHFHSLIAKLERNTLHAVGSINIQRTGSRGRLDSRFRTVRETGFVHRQIVGTCFGVTRLHYDFVVHAVDGDGHGARGNITVRIRIGVGELFRQCFAVRQFLHRRVVIVQLVAVGAVGVQSNGAVLPLLVRIPGELCSVRTSHGTFQSIALNGIGIAFRYLMLKAFNRRLVVDDIKLNFTAGTVAVRVRYCDSKVV